MRRLPVAAILVSRGSTCREHRERVEAVVVRPLQDTGGGLGLAVAWLLVQRGDPTGGLLPIFTLPPRDVVTGVVLMLLMGLLAGVMPAMGAMRLRITDALRRN